MKVQPLRRALTASHLVAWLVLAALSVAPEAQSQPIAFGKNKVHYSDFRWRVLESEHFHLYFYDEEEEFARQALPMAEHSYEELKGLFVHEVDEPIPLIIYSSHQDFEQTNITPFFLPEGVAGLTEFARGRVLIPFNGSVPEFRVTLQHELVHVFQRSFLARTYREHFRTPFLTTPLWFSEGLAVHWSEERNPEADMVLRDLTISGKLPAISEFWKYDGTYTLYKLGQSVLDYIGETYGEDRIHLFYERLWRWRSFEEGIEDVLGVRHDELSARWSYQLKERYFPQVTDARPAAFDSRALTAKGGADFKPLPLPRDLEGHPRHFVFLSPRDGFTNVYSASIEGEERDVETLIEGERQPEFESFHAFGSRMDVSAEGLLLVVTKHEDRDEIVAYSIPKREVVERFRFSNLVGLSSPSFDASGRRFVFSGLSRDGHSDIYLYHRDSAQLTRLTHDRYQDLDPAFSPYGEVVVWSSDRTAQGAEGARNLFRLDLESGEIRHLTRGRWVDAAPIWDPERPGLYFVSDRDGFTNVYWINEEGRGRRVTNMLDGILDPRPVPGEKSFLATVFHEGRFHVRSFAVPDTSGPAVELAPADTTAPWPDREPEGEVVSHEAAYRPRFSLDVAQGGVLVDPSLRSGEGVQAVLSDMMGNHLIFFQLSNSTVSTSNLLRDFSAGLTYVNLSHRLNYGVTAFHFSGDFYDGLGFPFSERQAGAGALLSYPLSKFERIETHLSFAYTETDRPSAGFRRRGPVGTHSVSFIRDNSLWLPTGPLDGQRFHLTAGLTMNLRRGAGENTLLLADWRRYFRLGLLSTYAVRAQARWSEGENPDFFQLGGSLSLRSYPRGAFAGRRSVLFNQEVRFPLMRGLVLGLPMGNLELPGVQGALFVDAGSAWETGWSPTVRGSYGLGLRMGLGGFLVLRLDVGRRTDFHDWGSRTHTDFYIGWNY